MEEMYKYLSNVAQKEIQKNKNNNKDGVEEIERIKKERDRLKPDQGYIYKVVLTWIVGAVISLLPTIAKAYMDSWAGEKSQEKVFCVKKFIETIFTASDLFLVISTLTISMLLETMFDNKKSNGGYVVVSISIILVVFSIYVCSFIQNNTSAIPYLAQIGKLTFIVCIANSFIGYILFSLKRGDGK